MEKRKRVVLLGGLGFIGKNLYQELIQHHEVKIVANTVYEDADDGFLTDEVRKNIIVGSILDKDFLDKTLVNFDVVFSLAGSSGAAGSISNPYHDLDNNLRGHLNILEVCRKNLAHALLIFPSSRLVYGKPMMNPVREDHPLNPESIYAIHKITTESYYLLYKKLYNLNCIIFRVSNPFGPYQRFGSNQYGILNWFIHKALNRESIELYGDGSQKRDFIFVDDLVKLFAAAMDRPDLSGRIFNAGSGNGISMREAVDTIANHIPGTSVAFKPWPAIDKKIETGDYISDVQTTKQAFGWSPSISFEKGIKATIDFYAREEK